MPFPPAPEKGMRWTNIRVTKVAVGSNYTGAFWNIQFLLLVTITSCGLLFIYY